MGSLLLEVSGTKGRCSNSNDPLLVVTSEAGLLSFVLIGHTQTHDSPVIRSVVASRL